MTSAIRLVFLCLCVLLPVTKSENATYFWKVETDSIKDMIDIAYSSIQQVVQKIKDLEHKLKTRQDVCEWRPYKGHLYFFSEDTHPWQEAELACRDMGSHLVTIEDMKENQWIQEIIEHTHRQMWIGLKQDKCKPSRKKSGWRWESNFSTPRFTQWATGEPNSDNEKCAHIDASKKCEWNDNYCYQKFYYICERTM